MKYLVLSAVLFLVSCAGQSVVQTTAQVCGVYSSTLVSLAVYKPKMSDSQKALVDDAVSVLAPTCEGDIPEGDADSLLTDSLDKLEALLIQLRKGQ